MISNKLKKKDIQVILMINQWIEDSELLSTIFNETVSNAFYKDINLLLTPIFLWGWLEFKVHFFWCSVINLFGAYGAFHLFRVFHMCNLHISPFFLPSYSSQSNRQGPPTRLHKRTNET